ncbi:hypothetical protein Q5741_20115 [Paenibacillus sp. JX-17]|uniref:Uncharacterized protein n=1 Tax=Paenibacillus lacisoli TaxID=3064525 RepID=A0ABT9CM21_9BACL|nr:hypothetical protein [Paenibacillus sp. JX-17]MDO7908696.1 hypothetical protein [Paenibacillus sp. JX-17]
MNRELNMDQQQLAGAWQEQMGNILQPGDQATVLADEADPNALRIHIDSSGRQMYSFDFKCAYVDSREVRVELVDVERSGLHVDERTGPIQELASDYTRQIHECAQTLQQLTHP